ncbi:hypothetical protein EDB87DRAFT_1617075, partial [Lactarius vividus]
MVVETLSERVDGMFRWVYCQLDTLQQSQPSSVQRTLEELPESLDETYERIVMEIKKSNRANAYRMLQCLAVAIRPLSVAELAELLAFEFDAAKGGFPKMNMDWRWEDHEQAVHSICSSLITIVPARRTYSSRAVHIVLEDANTVLSQACLGVLLHDPVDPNIAKSVSLAHYAARNWVTHAQFENVAPRIHDGMRRLFDPNKPYLSAWLKLHDVDRGFVPDEFQNKRQPRAAPLYYAALCGFNELVTVLATETPQYAGAIGGGSGTALHAASLQGHVQVIQSLLQYGVDVNIWGRWDQTPLHFASQWGHISINAVRGPYHANIPRSNVRTSP